MHTALSLFINADSYMLPCLNKKLFGVACPGCGIQRAVVLLFKGEFGAAFAMYPAIYTLLLLFGFLAFNKFYTVKHANKIIITLAVINLTIILTNYILKLYN